MSNHQIFHGILTRIGQTGLYQNISMLIWFMFGLINGSINYITAFLYSQKTYECSSTIQNCQQYVCRLQPNQRYNYINDNFVSLANSFGDFRCNRQELNNMLTFIYFGGIVGLIIGSIANQYMGKRKLLILSVILSIIGAVIPFIAQNLFIASVGIFITYAAMYIQLQIVPCIMTQTLSKQTLGKQLNILYIGFSLGFTLNGLVFMIFKDWRTVLIIYQIIPFILLFGCLIFFIQQTPFDSIVNHTPIESLQTFKRIAKWNERQYTNLLTLEQISKIKQQYQLNIKQKHDYKISILDLFRYDSLRQITIISILLHFFMSYQFNVPELVIQDYSIDMSWGGIILGIAAVISYIILYFLINNYQRRKAIIYLTLVSLLISLLILIFVPCVSKCSIQISIIQIIGLFFFKICIDISYAFYYIAQFQMFPTQIRSIATQFTAILSATAVIISPYIHQFCKDHDLSIITTFSMSCLLTILIAYKMPQTYNIIPSQMIKQLQYIKQPNK